MATDLLQQTALADLLTGTVKAIAQAQAALDAAANQENTQFADLPDGALVVPPLRLAIQNATVELEMSAAVSAQELQCRLLNPHQVALFGYQAASGLRVRLTVGSNGVAPIKAEGGE